MLEFLKDKHVATIVPTAPWTIKRIREQMDLTKQRIILEYGVGRPVFPRRIMPHLTDDSKYIGIERHMPFVQAIRDEKEFVDYPNFHILQGGAEHAKRHLQEYGEHEADYVISGIPFSRIPINVTKEIVEQTHEILKPDGIFFVYQCRTGVRKELERVFAHVERRFEPWNLPPLTVFTARK